MSDIRLSILAQNWQGVPGAHARERHGTSHLAPGYYTYRHALLIFTIVVCLSPMHYRTRGLSVCLSVCLSAQDRRSIPSLMQLPLALLLRPSQILPTRRTMMPWVLEWHGRPPLYKANRHTNTNKITSPTDRHYYELRLATLIA